MAEGKGTSGEVGGLTRRAAVGAMAAAAVGYAAFGPRGVRERTGSKIVLEYWEKWTGQEELAMRRIVDEFNASQDRIFVRMFSMSAIDQKAMVAIAGGDPPDVLGLWNFSIPVFAECGAIQPLDPLIAQHGERIAGWLREKHGEPGFTLLEERYTGPAWRLMHVNGSLWGAVNTCGTLGLYYNRAAFREAGLDPDKPPRTIDELDAAAERLTITDGSGEMVRAGFLQREPGWWNWIWGYHFGGALTDPSGLRMTTADPKNIAAYRWVQSYPEKFGSTRLVSFSSGLGNYNSVQQPLLAGKVAMALHGAFLANVIGRFKPDFDYAAAPFPVERSVYDEGAPVGLLESDLLVIPRGVKHPEASLEFIAFTQRRRAVEDLAVGHAKPTPLREVSADFVPRHPNRSIAVHNAMVASPRAFLKPMTPVWRRYENEFNQAIDAFWLLKRPAEDILKDLERRMQGEVDAVVDRRRRRGRDGGMA